MKNNQKKPHIYAWRNHLEKAKHRGFFTPQCSTCGMGGLRSRGRDTALGCRGAQMPADAYAGEGGSTECINWVHKQVRGVLRASP